MSQVIENAPLVELSLYISKVSVDKANGGVMRWRAVASDTAPDLYREMMSNELYDDFIARIKSGAKVPTPFDAILNEEWNGGMPYISISHYKSGTGMKNVPGIPDSIYRDGDKLKATGVLYDNPMGHAVFKSLCDDLYTEKAHKDGKIRISIGFLDLEHKHLGEGNIPDFLFTRSGLDDKCPKCLEGIGNKVYTKGQLVHLALTRVPVNPRTDMEASKSMAIETKLDDAESIIGKELSEALEEKSLVASDAIVIKSDSESTEVEKAKVVEDETSKEDAKEDSAEMKKEPMMKGKSELVERKKVATDATSEDLTYEEDDEEKRQARRNTPAGEKSMLEKSFVSLEAKIVELKSQGIPAESALREIQPLFSAFGEEVKKSFETAPTAPVDANSSAVSELINAVKSLTENMSTFQQTVSTELATLKAQVSTKSVVTQKSGIPEPRSISANALPAQAKRDPNQPLSIRELAIRSTYGQ